MRIKFYLPRLTDADLLDLCRYAAHLRHRSRRLGVWLVQVCETECVRRHDLRRGDPPREALLPDFPLSPTWTHADIVSGLRALTGLSYSARNNLCGELLDQLVLVFTSLASCALRDADKAPQNCGATDTEAEPQRPHVELSPDDMRAIAKQGTTGIFIQPTENE